MTIRQASGVPKGRPAAAAWLAAFIEDAKRSGFVERALKESGAGRRDDRARRTVIPTQNEST